jgi:hypothetical protein
MMFVLKVVLARLRLLTVLVRVPQEESAVCGQEHPSWKVFCTTNHTMPTSPVPTLDLVKQSQARKSTRDGQYAKFGIPTALKM